MINNSGTIILGGVTYPFQVDAINQSEAFCDTLKVDLDEYEDKLKEMANSSGMKAKKMTVVYIYSALYAGAINDTDSCSFTYQNVVKWYNNASPEEHLEFAKIFALLTDVTKKKTEQLITALKSVNLEELSKVMKPEEINQIKSLIQ